MSAQAPVNGVATDLFAASATVASFGSDSSVFSASAFAGRLPNFL